MISPSPSTKTPLHVASILALATIAALDCAYLILHLGQVGQLEEYYWGNQDFRDAVYYPCRAVYEGINPYDVTVYGSHFAGKIGNIFPLYSPLTLLLHFPLVFLPYHAAGWVFQAANFVILLVVCSLALRCCGWKADVTNLCGVATLVLFSEPGRCNMVHGQVTWPLVLASYLALALSRSKPAWSGAALAISTYKPTYAVAIGFFMLCRGDWKALSYSIIWTALATLAGLGLMAGCGIDVLHLPHLLASNHAALLADPSVQPHTTLERVDLPVFLSKALGVLDDSWLMLAGPAFVMLITGWLVWLETRGEKNFAPDSFATFLICLGSLVGVYHHVYDLILLTLPMLALFTATHPSWQRLSRPGLMLLRAGLLILALNVFWTSPAVRLGKLIASLAPVLFEPWFATCWQAALLLNPVLLVSLWLLASYLCLASRARATAGLPSTVLSNPR